MADLYDTEALQRAALEHLWMHNRDWAKMGEEGGPPIIVDGKGIRVIDSDGHSWIDVNGGYNSVNVGYGRTEIADAAREQMLKLAYFPQASTTEPLVKFVEKLAQMAPGNLERIWPVTGGSEANETAIKIARVYQKRVGGSGRYKIISRRRSYHGATGGVMWLGDHPGRADYGPSMTGMVYAPQPNPYRCEFGGKTPSQCAVKCAEALEDLILFHDPSTVAAFIAEPVSAAAAAAVPGDEYWPMIRQICDKYGVLLIADEVICGFGRTGKMFATEHWGLVPDIMTVAKGVVSSYLPIAATIASTEIAEVFTGEDNFFSQALTFGGHPVAAAASLKNIEIIENERMVENAAETGDYMLGQFKDLQAEHPIIGDVRGIGLLQGMELVNDRDTKSKFPPELKVGERLSEKFRQQGLILGAQDNSVGVSPPLCITKHEVDELVAAVDRAFTNLEAELPTVQ